MQKLRHALSLHHKIYPHLPNPVAIVLMVAPILLKLGKSSPVALWLSVVTRVTALLLPALTATRRGLSGSSVAGCISGWTAHWVWSPSLPPPLSISLGLTPGTTGFSPLRSC